jgi:hypothetical protein
MPRGLPGVLHPQFGPHNRTGFRAIMATRGEVPHHIVVAWVQCHEGYPGFYTHRAAHIKEQGSVTSCRP